MTLNIILLCILLILSAFFSSSETAFTSLSTMQLKGMKSKRGKLIRKMTNRPDILLTTILFGNNLVNIGASAITTSTATDLFGDAGAGIAVGVLTFVILIFAEVAPKQIALIHNEFIARQTAIPIYLLSIIFRPFVLGINLFGSFITKIFSKQKRKTISLEGILHIVNIAEDQGLVDNQENYMVKKVFKLNDVPVHAIMTHRKDVFSLDSNLTVAEAVDQIKDSTFSRIPVYKDDTETIVGIILQKKLLEEYSSGNHDTQIRKIMLEPFYIQEAKKVKDLFSLFKSNHMKIAIVLDEYGGLAGIVTQEDVVEEIFGELYDEMEIEKDELYIKLGENHYSIKGEAPLHEIEELLPNIEKSEESYIRTIAGFFTEQLTEIPNIGTTLKYKNYKFTVTEMDKNKIENIDVEIHSELQEE